MLKTFSRLEFLGADFTLLARIPAPCALWMLTGTRPSPISSWIGLPLFLDFVRSGLPATARFVIVLKKFYSSGCKVARRAFEDLARG